MVLENEVFESNGELNDDSPSSIDSPELIAALKRLHTKVALLELHNERLQDEHKMELEKMTSSFETALALKNDKIKKLEDENAMLRELANGRNENFNEEIEERTEEDGNDEVANLPIWNEKNVTKKSDRVSGPKPEVPLDEFLHDLMESLRTDHKKEIEQISSTFNTELVFKSRKVACLEHDIALLRKENARLKSTEVNGTVEVNSIVPPSEFNDVSESNGELNDIMEDNETVAVNSIGPLNQSSHSSVPQIVRKRQQYAKGRPRKIPLGSKKKIGILGATKGNIKLRKPECYLEGESESEDYFCEDIDEEIVQCQWDSCTEEYSTQMSLVDHVYHHHIEHDKDHKCLWKGCKREEPFSKHHHLLEHVRRHTGEKPNVCQYGNCRKSYSRLVNLKTHMRSHTGEKPYQCQFPNCTKAFSCASNRSKHQNRTHFDSKPYECTISGCNKRYTDPSTLRRHIKDIHGDEAYEKKKNKPAFPHGRRHKLPIATQIQLGQLLSSTNNKGQPNKYYYNPQRCEEEQRGQEAGDSAVMEGTQ